MTISWPGMNFSDNDVAFIAANLNLNGLAAVKSLFLHFTNGTIV